MVTSMQGDDPVAGDAAMDTAADSSAVHPYALPTSPPPPILRTRSKSATAAAERMRAKRSSSRVTDSTPSRHSDDESTKTAVKVAVRIRPPLNPNDPGFDLIPQRFRESTCEVPSPTSLVVQSHQGKKHFIFDQVFDEATSQQDVWGYVSEAVGSFVQGYNVSILAYGQSGAGKSYTMGTSGPEEQNDVEHMGIVPRAAQTLFEKLGNAPSKAMTGLRTPKRYSTATSLTTLGHMASSEKEKNWTLKATYVEIYNETLNDLLLPEDTPQTSRASVAIREDKGKILLTGLTQVEIKSPEDLLLALNHGSKIRQTDATAINARSSRSHAVFSLNLVQKKTDASMSPKKDKRFSVPLEAMSNGETVVTVDSKLHFVDLAGSERLKNTGATGERAKEGISINAGLASLGKVISQLSSKHAGGHISYRDSRLTRLLQDSLGGNAITFMVACVTPAAFHMNETLNTLHYAQRARAIQLRPEIQQSHEEGDKQAAIERLRTEVSFLRDQIRHSDQPTERPNGTGERSNRREAELQTQLMDMQENYNALSQRHAKLISEISKARDANSDTPMLREAIGENAMERLQRSNSFAEAVEQVVLEYEKTIQSLESSLSITRSSLSNTESTLLERETKITYMETMQQQLQNRMNKTLTREQDAENYLRDLESRMEGAASGEENQATVISELRKELARARENGNNAEDYISTLEERLAEAEQDQDIMQREIDRLEQVVERQRSIGRLDNLLSELDSVRGNGTHEAGGPLAKAQDQQRPITNGHRESYDPFRPGTPSAAGDDDYADAGSERRDREASQDDDISALPSVASFPARPSSRETNSLPTRNAAQDDFMADKLENVTQELFDLRSEHESVVTDYDNLHQKYQTALETLARLEYDKEVTPKSAATPAEGNSRPESQREYFLADAGMRGEEEGDEQPSSSRSLLLEGSSRGEQMSGEKEEVRREVAREVESKRRSISSHLGVRNEVAVQDDNSVDPTAIPLPEDEDYSTQELETLRRLHAEQEVSVLTLTNNYKSLAEKHESSLKHVDELKTELQRLHHMQPASPVLGRPSSPALGSPGFKPILRRRSDDLLGSDRASRAFASLKNIALDNFDEESNAQQNFEVNLNMIMNELHARSERVHALEAEVTTVRREMEGKQAIITGLTRERSSLKAGAGAGVDFSVVGQMRGQLQESENQIRALHEQHAAREREFGEQIESLKRGLQRSGEGERSLEAEEVDEHVPGFFPVTPALELSQAQATSGADGRQEDVARLQAELAAWETRHNDAMDSMQASEARLLQTIAGLEESMRQAEQSNPRGLGILDPPQVSEDERANHRQVVDALQREVDEYKSTSAAHVGKLEQLEQAYAKILAQVNEDSNSRDLTQKELHTHKELVANLENQLMVHKEAVALHQESLDNLHQTHSREVEELLGREKEARESAEGLGRSHVEAMEGMERELNRVQGEHSALLASAAAALGTPTDSSMLRGQIEALVNEGKDLHSRHAKVDGDLRNVQQELQSQLTKTTELEGRIAELKSLHEEAMTSLEQMTEKERKSSRLVDELEEQLNSNFDSHRAANHRLSRMETASVQARQEMERELEELKMRNGVLEQQVSQHRASITSDRGNRESLSPDAAAIALARSPSQQSAARKSSNVTTALPTPPPSIPLPPIPGNNTAALDRATSPPASSPPSSRHASKDHSSSHNPLLQLEETETRLRTLEKHLFAEKQLTATLEEALVDLETSTNRTKTDLESWRGKCKQLEDELVGLRKQRSESRASLQAVEEEREMRVRAERARQALEQRMMELNGNGPGGKKKKKGGLNCF